MEQGELQNQRSSKTAEYLKSKVSSLRPHCLYHKRELNRLFRTHIRDSAQWVGRLDFFAI
jgi:hypothetical protein